MRYADENKLCKLFRCMMTLLIFQVILEGSLSGYRISEYSTMFVSVKLFM